MSNFDIIKTSSPKKSFRVASVMGRFDLQSNEIVEQFKGDINLPEKWSVGLIVGKSGSGKTTIAKQLFPNQYITTFDYSADTILDDMPEDKTVDEIVKTFNSVGFSSPPSWLKPYSVLSNGEKMRVDLARAILSENNFFVFDEFTSVVDRQVAKVGSFAMQKSIRKTNKQFIAVTCHYDVKDWLLPDWIFCTDDMTFQNCEGQKKNRPEIGIKIFETKDKSKYWKLFARHHYLNHSHANMARTFIMTVDDEIAGFCSILHFAHPKVKTIKQGHRVVVLPDFQGLSLGLFLIKKCGDIILSEGNRFTFTTSNPAMIFAFKKDDDFVCTSHGRKSKSKSKSKSCTIMNKVSSNRITVSYEYKPKQLI